MHIHTLESRPPTVNPYPIYGCQSKSQIILFLEIKYPHYTPVISAGECLIKNHLFIAQLTD